MNKALLTLLLPLLFGLQAQAQWQWAVTDTAHYEINPTYVHQITASGSGKILWASLLKVRLPYGQDAYGPYRVAEMDPATGNVTSSTVVNGRFAFHSAVADDAGNWYLTGAYYDTVDFADGAHLERDSNGMGADHFLVKLHSGTLATDWVVNIENSYFFSADKIHFANGALYVPVVTFDSTMICLYDLNTGAQSRLFTQYGESRTGDIKVDANGNIYMYGSCAFNGLDFNGVSDMPPAAMTYPAYLVRYRADGTHDWHQWLNDLTCIPRELVLVNNNLIYFAGLMGDSMTVGGHHFTPASSFFSDFVMARLDSTGTAVWARQLATTDTGSGSYSFDGINFTAAGPDSTLFFSGNMRFTIDWGNGVVLTPPIYYSDNAFIVNIAPDGSTNWGTIVSADGSDQQSLASDGQNVYISGTGGDSTSVDFGTHSIPATYGHYVPWLARAGNTGSGIVSHNQSNNAFHAYPNPATDEIVLSLLAAAGEGEEIRVCNVTGQTVWTGFFEKGTVKKEIPVSTLPRGFYWLELTNQKGTSICKIMLQ